MNRRVHPLWFAAVSAALFVLTALLFAGWMLTSASASANEPRARFPFVAADGAFPTPTPVPVPTIARHCYAARDDSGGFTLRPAPATSVLRNCQVIAYYGVPGVPG
ncbi:MAG: hypothetical protein ABIQ47_00360, partial [Tepidiformaceae bacterium]